MDRRRLLLMLALSLAACAVVIGCTGETGPPGPPGLAADRGMAPDALRDALPDAADAMPDAIDAMDGTPDAIDAMPDATDAIDAAPDAAPPPDCPPWHPPAGLGGVADARVDLAEAARGLDFRRAREEERLLAALDPARVAARYRIEHPAIAADCYALADLIDLGRGLFLRRFTLAEGYGNNLAGHPGTLAGDRPPPNLRRLQRGHFGGPDAASCADCHWKGGLAGAGDRADNSLLYGDGEHLSTHEPRNPPALWGAGWTERIAAEMTAELHAQLAAARARAAATEEPVRIALSAKGTRFGLATAHPDGRVDTAAVQGIDPDLIVKPFGWKGVFPTLRAFVAHSLHIHFNLQAEELIAAPGELDLGGPAGFDLANADPDRDGVAREITEGQLTALVLFLATLDPPRLDVPTEGAAADPFVPELPEIVDAPEFTDRWFAGAEVFGHLGCAGCHTPFMTVGDPIYRTRAALTGAEVTLDLARDGARPHPPRDAADQTWLVPVFSDFRRHDMGPLLTGPHPERGVAESVWLTRRLWGLAQTGPYLHDGSAVTITEAIARHGGEAAFAAEGYLALPEADRASLGVFLGSLRRAPAIRVR